MRVSRSAARRKAIAGILSAVILFSLVFTVGAGFYIAANDAQQSATSAYISRLSVADEIRLEALTLKATLSGQSLMLMINNTGGVPSTIETIYVTETDGANVSDFLVGSPGLNESLPVTLNIGASTEETGGNIMINSTAFDFDASGQANVFINVLTRLGNVFSVSYPTLSSITLRNLVVNRGVLDEYISSQLDSDVYEQQIVAGCSGCVTGVYVGGNILVLLLTATPSPVSSGGTITVEATVSDYSVYSASEVEVSLTAVYSSTASVSPNVNVSPSDCGSAQTIASEQSVTFTCDFEASAGSSGGGTVTFEGVATGCIATPTTTTTGTTTTTSTSSCSGTSASSSTTSSNPVQVGSAESVGAWQPNFDYYYDTACSSTSCPSSSPCYSLSDDCSAAVVPNTEYYAAIYIEVSNDYNTPLTILEGSYIQSVSTSIDFDLFLTENPANYAVSPPTLTAYGCIDSAPLVPEDTVSGQSCLTVEPGATVTLMFAASAPGGSAWEWGSSYPGGTSFVGGDNAQIILEFAKDSNGVWASATQDIPFEGLYVT